MTKKRPFGVTVLAVLAGLAAIIAIIHTLQLLHLWPIWIGPVRFFAFDLFGAILWGFLAAIFSWAAYGLWNLDAGAWLFVIVMAVLNLILAVVMIAGASTIEAMFPTILVSAIILVYGLLPSVKKAFKQAA